MNLDGHCHKVNSGKLIAHPFSMCLPVNMAEPGSSRFLALLPYVSVLCPYK